jgi:hypothetical protein
VVAVDVVVGARWKSLSALSTIIDDNRRRRHGGGTAK